MVRIKDVAEAVGVSTATVSNVINGKEQRVSKEVREKSRRLWMRWVTCEIVLR